MEALLITPRRLRLQGAVFEARQDVVSRAGRCSELYDLRSCPTCVKSSEEGSQIISAAFL